MMFDPLVEGCLSYLEIMLLLRTLVVVAFKHYVTVVSSLALAVGVLVGFIIGKQDTYKPSLDLNFKEAGSRAKRQKKTPDKFIRFVRSRILILLLAFSDFASALNSI